MKILFFVCGALWLMCPVIVFGTINAFEKKEDCYRLIGYRPEDYSFYFGWSVFTGLLLGPVAVLISLFMTGLWYRGFDLKYRSRND
jgi:hypothetical protein